MKLQIDTTNKIITVEERVNLGTLIEQLSLLMPTDWRDYSIECKVIQNWINPISIPTYPVPTYPVKPFWDQPWYVTCQNESRSSDYISNLNSAKAVYNLDI